MRGKNPNTNGARNATVMTPGRFVKSMASTFSG